MTNGDEPIQPCIIQYTIDNEIATGYTVSNGTQINGLTKREYFAAMAEIPWNSVIEMLFAQGDINPSISEIIDRRARLKVLEADKLINELNKPAQ